MAIWAPFAASAVRPPPRVLSKSKMLFFRQCPKRLWLEMYRPELQETSASTISSFTVRQVGEVARRLYDPKSTGEVIDPQAKGVAAAMVRTQTLLGGSVPIVEAGFEAGGAPFAGIIGLRCYSYRPLLRL